MSLFLKSIYLSTGLSLFYIYFIYRSHPWRQLSSTTVTLTFFVGMIALIPVALLRSFLPLNGGEIGFSSFVSAGVIEEAVKFFLMLITVWRYGFPDVAEPVDLAIYFGILGVGFGVYEDFWYIFGGSYDLWAEGDIGRFSEVFRSIILARAFPGHILFNGLAGFLVGYARFCTRGCRRFAWLAMGFLSAVALHGLFNLIAHVGGRIALLTYIVLLVGLFYYCRRLSMRVSPFRVLIARIIEGKRDKWAYPHSPIEYLFAEGFSWPQEGRGGMFQVFPLFLALTILYPVLFGVVYFLHRLAVWGLKG